MNYLSVDYCILYAFLVLILIVGLRAGRGIKDIRDFAVGSGAYGAGLLVLTYLATNMGPGTINESVSWPFSDGIIGTAMASGLFISFMFRALVIAPKMKFFKNCLSMADVIGSMYGKAAQITTGILATICCVCIIGFGFSAFGVICESILKVNPTTGIITAGLLIALYTAHGGIKSVAATDVVQFICLFLVIAIIAGAVVHNLSGIGLFMTQIPQERFIIFNHQKFPFYFTAFLIFSIFSIGLTDPPIFQRLLMAKNAKSIRNQYFLISIIDPTVRILLMIIGLGALILYPTLEAKYILPHVIQQLLPEGLKGLAMCGMVALFMGCVDSYLHVAGVMLTNDIVKPLFCPTASRFSDLKFIKSSIFLITGFAIWLSLNAIAVLELGIVSIMVTGAVIVFPLIVGILGLKPDKKSFFVAMWATIVAFVLSKFMLPVKYGHFTIIISILTNIITFLIAHYVQNKGFVTLTRNEDFVDIVREKRISFSFNVTDNTQKTKEDKSFVIVESKKCESGGTEKKFGFCFKNLFVIITTLGSRLAALCKKMEDIYGKVPYVTFGVIMGCCYTMPYFLWMPKSPEQYNFLLYLRFLGGIMCGLMVVKVKWPQCLLRFMPLYWYITILYVAPFTATIMLLLNQPDVAWVMTFVAALFFVFCLVGLAGAIIINVLGILLGCYVYSTFIGPVCLDINIADKSILFYPIVFGVVSLIFLCKKQIHWRKYSTEGVTTGFTKDKDLLQTAQEGMRVIKALNDAGINTLYDTTMLARKVLAESEKTLGDTAPITVMLKQVTTQIKDVAIEIDNIENRAHLYLPLDVPPKPIPIIDLIDNVRRTLRLVNKNRYVKFYGKLKYKTENGETDKLIHCDTAKIETMLVNAISAMRGEVDEDDDIYVMMKEVELEYTIKDTTNTIIRHTPAWRFCIVTDTSLLSECAMYKVNFEESNIKVIGKADELPLQQSKRIAQAHFGYSNLEDENRDKRIQEYVIPLAVRKFRPKEFDTKEMLVGSDWAKAKENAGAKEIEGLLLKEIQQKSKARIELVKEAIARIKKYHGPVNRNSGEPYYIHPMEATRIVLNMNQDEETILAALLHDIVEDTPAWSRTVAMMFGETVCHLVEGVTNLACLKNGTKIMLPKIDILRRLAKTDSRAFCIKVADRIHNLRTIDAQKKPSQIGKAEDTLQNYVELARSYGFEAEADEMERLSMDVINKYK